MSLSLAMIVKDEAEVLDRCLASVRGLVDEIVVVDTGSADATTAIAARHGARVSSFTWCDDFAAARNAALERCTGDWVLVLDADEALDPGAFAPIRAAMAQSEVPAFHLEVRNYLAGGGACLDDAARPNPGDYAAGAAFPYIATFPVLRLAKRLPDLRFQNRIHEVLGPYFQARNLPIGALEARIHHFGKAMPEREAAKAGTYLRMALEEAAQDPADLQKCFNVLQQALVAGAWTEALEAAEAYLAHPVPPPFLVLLGAAMALQELGRPADSLPHLERLLAAAPDHALGHLRRGQGLAALGRRDEARTSLLQALVHQPTLAAAAVQLADLEADEGRAEAGRAHLLALLDRAPQDPQATEYLVIFDLKHGMQGHAVADAARVLAARPQTGAGAYHQLVVVALVQGGRDAEGCAVLQQGLAAFPEHPGLLRLSALLK